jgi:hypothetical protein
VLNKERQLIRFVLDSAPEPEANNVFRLLFLKLEHNDDIRTRTGVSCSLGMDAMPNKVCSRCATNP